LLLKKDGVDGVNPLRVGESHSVAPPVV
jgi:hypothetical protein